MNIVLQQIPTAFNIDIKGKKNYILILKCTY